MFCDTEIEKHKFPCHKNPIFIDDVDINKIIVSNKVSLGEKGFTYIINYNDNEKVKPLWIMLPKVSGYRKFGRCERKNALKLANILPFKLISNLWLPWK